jgi:cellulose synthase (UDP-forming)
MDLEPMEGGKYCGFLSWQEYVDWIGINILNYAEYNQDGQWHDFKSLYQPFHES